MSNQDDETPFIPPQTPQPFVSDGLTRHQIEAEEEQAEEQQGPAPQPSPPPPIQIKPPPPQSPLPIPPPPQAPAPVQPIEPTADKSAPPMPPDPYDPTTKPADLPKSPMPFDPFDRSTWPRADKAAAQDRTNKSLFGMIGDFVTRLFRMEKQLEVVMTQLPEVYPPRISSSDDGSGGAGIEVKISSIVAGQIGRYNAKSYNGVILPNSTGTLAEANLGTLAAADNCIVWHSPEIAIGSTKHLLKTGATYTGRLAGQNSAGKNIVIIGVIPVGETASPKTLDGHGSLTADATTWSRATDGVGKSETYVSHIEWDTSTHGLYAFYRTRVTDAAGLEISTTGETKVTVNIASSGCA